MYPSLKGSIDIILPGMAKHMWLNMSGEIILVNKFTFFFAELFFRALQTTLIAQVKYSHHWVKDLC